ncbi:2Fe-2S iron-sulfur cluster-binding protein [Streptomyces sp. NPDC048416]|uniref:2Fe-2S iron-sulfur cluster-binding protein n=1 Tax=Streptomyces sp. NPDC048416 TaxID=3365546 RepID=UPI00371ADD51
MEPRHGRSDGGPGPGAQTDTSATESHVSLRVNGTTHRIELDHRVTLLECLRGNLGLTGSQQGCHDGECGMCTVLLDGRRVSSCLLLAIAQEGHEITTIEGLAVTAGTDDDRHPLRHISLEREAVRCGYCAPGQASAAAGTPADAAAGQASVVSEMDLPSDVSVRLTAIEIREQLSGNLCRCGAYPGAAEVLHDATAQGANGTDDTYRADGTNGADPTTCPANPQDVPPQDMAIQDVTT